MSRFLPVLSLVCAFSAMARGADLPLVERRLDASFRQCLIPVEKGQLSCYRRPGTGPTLLLIPGTFSDARNYVATVRALDPSYELLILEHRGIGGSWPPPVTASIEACADAIDVLDTLGVKTCYVGGAAWGHDRDRTRAADPGAVAWDHCNPRGWTSSQAAVDAFQSDMKSTLSPEQSAELAAYRTEILHRWTPEQREMFGTIWKKWSGAKSSRRHRCRCCGLYPQRSKPAAAGAGTARNSTARQYRTGLVRRRVAFTAGGAAA
ncbi:MAG: hypothetical protein U0992_11255 [Planctomycetaceae bacterium]